MARGPEEDSFNLTWHCSLAKGHDGNHIAYEEHDPSKKVLIEWPAPPSVPAGPQEEKKRPAMDAISRRGERVNE